MNRHTSCEFAFAAYWEMVEYGNEHPFGSAMSRRFRVDIELPALRRPVRMSARAIPRAHGTHDFKFNNKKFGGKRLVHLDNATLP